MLKPVPLRFGLPAPPAVERMPLLFALMFEMLKYMRPEIVVESHHLPLEKVASSVLTAAGTALDATVAALDAAVCAATAAVCAWAAWVDAVVAATWALFTLATVSRWAASVTFRRALISATCSCSALICAIRAALALGALWWTGAFANDGVAQSAS